MELERRDGFKLTGNNGSCQRFSRDVPVSAGVRCGLFAEIRRPNATRRAPRTRGGLKVKQTTPDERAYDVSPAKLGNGALRDAITKGHDSTRGSNSPRARRTLPHCGQRTGSVGSMVVDALPCNADFASNSFRAKRNRASR